MGGKIFLIFFSAFALMAAPRLDRYVDIEGTRLYQDHLNGRVWYIQPAPPALAQEEGEPAYRLDLFRYLGRSGTSDRNRFWARGVFTLTLKRHRDPAILARIKKKLANRYGASVKIVSLPSQKTVLQLVVGDMNVTKESEGGWSQETFTVGLDPVMAQILWKAVETNATVVTATTTDWIPGVVKEADEWRDSTTTISTTLPITLDRGKYPHRFTRTDIGGRMERGYTKIEIFDFNFVEKLIPGLYAEIVEVMIPTEGRPLIEKVEFTQDGDYHQSVRFRLSKKLDEPYRYRIERIYEDGRRKRSKWLRKEGETMLDITQYAEKARRQR